MLVRRARVITAHDFTIDVASAIARTVGVKALIVAEHGLFDIADD